MILAYIFGWWNHILIIQNTEKNIDNNLMSVWEVGDALVNKAVQVLTHPGQLVRLHTNDKIEQRNDI